MEKFVLEDLIGKVIILDLLNALYFLLKNPNFGDGYNNKQVKEFYEANPDEYHNVVRELVKEFHKP